MGKPTLQAILELGIVVAGVNNGYPKERALREIQAVYLQARIDSLRLLRNNYLLAGTTDYKTLGNFIKRLKHEQLKQLKEQADAE